MFSNKLVYIATIISFFQFCYCFGQERIVPPSPNAASLGLFCQIPVTPYTGVPNISIPIYTIKSGSITLPINLSYHASGIKVAQEASWVGLGWALEAGGVITRTVHGYDDFEVYPKGFYYAHNFPNVGDNNNFNPENADNAFEYYSEIKSGSIDGEPDMFNLNVNGYSENFFFQKKNEDNISIFATPICTKRNNLDIKYNTLKKTWIVTDGKGYRYYFGTQEITETFSNSFESPWNNKPGLHLLPSDVQREVVTSWYLDRIETNSGDYVTFTYDSRNHPVKSQIYCNEVIYKLTKFEENQIHKDEPQPLIPLPGFPLLSLLEVYKSMHTSPDIGGAFIRKYSYYQTITREKYLNQITFNNGKVVFNTSDRNDMEISTPPYAHNNFKAQKLESIEISDNQNTILKCRFNHSYFNIDNPNPSQQRSKLNSLDFFDKNIIKMNRYEFGYDDRQLPNKTSSAVDYWGLYNGKENTLEWGNISNSYFDRGTLIPGLETVQDGRIVKVMGADREIDPEKNQCGILTSIRHPTGGETVFTYESNSYSNFQPFNVDNYITSSVGAGDKYNSEDGYELYSDMVEFTINEPQTVDINYGFFDPYITDISEDKERKTCSFYSSISGNFANLYQVNDDNTLALIEAYTFNGGLQYDSTLAAFYNKTWQPRFSDKQFLHPGKYRIEAIAIQQNNGTSYDISAKYKNSSTLIYNKLGGGLRIREIKNNSEYGSTKKMYDYTKDGVVSSGLLMSNPSHFLYLNMMQTVLLCASSYLAEDSYKKNYVGAMSNSYDPLGYSALGSPVGYDLVKETTEGNGKTVYYYHNTADHLADFNGGIIVPGVPSLSNLDNGLLKKMEIYDNDGNIKTTKENLYTKHNSFNNSVKGVKTYTFFDSRMAIKFYDNIGEWWKLDRTITTNHVGGKELKDTTSFEYNLKNLLPNKILIQSGTDKAKEKQITYPCDITCDDTYDTYKIMTDNNIIEYPIEERDYVGGKFVKGTLNTFYASGLPYEKYIAELKTPLTSFCIFNDVKDSHYPLLPEIKINEYGTNGNVYEVIQKDGSIITYLWGYNTEYPIAEIKNASYAQVEGALSGITPNDLAHADVPDMVKVEALRTALPNAMVTTYTYKPLVGMTSSTDPRGVTTYYEYDDFNRLKQSYIIENGEKKILQKYDYHYATQQ